MATDLQQIAREAALDACRRWSVRFSQPDGSDSLKFAIADAVRAALQPYLREGADPAPDPDYRRVTSQEMLDDLRELREWRQGVRRVAPFSEGADPAPPAAVERAFLASLSKADLLR